MNANSINIFERHVEKIVLAVAAAGALFIGYLGLQPVTVPDTTVKASEVEDQVSQQVAKLEAVRKQTAARNDLTPRVQNYLAQYEKVMYQHPLPQDLIVASAVPHFAPLQEGLGAIGIEDRLGNGGQMQVVTPAVPAPKDVTVVSARGTVSLTPPPPPGGEAPPAPLPGAVAAGPQTFDKNWVCISGNIPWADFVARLNDPALPNTAKLSPGEQRVVLYRVEVQRRTRVNGIWGAYEDVTPAKLPNALDLPTVPNWGAVSDADLPNAVTAIDAAFKQIAEPDFYFLANGQPIIPPIVQPKPAPTTAPLPGRPPVAAPGRPGTIPPAVAGRPGFAGAPVPPASPDDSEAPPAPTAVPGIPDVATLRQQPLVPFWFYDDSVQPNHDYQYQVRLVMYNPTYRYPAGLKNPAMKDQPTIASAWVPLPTTVTVDSDLYFFVNNNFGNNTGPNPKASFVVLKWTSDHWHRAEWNQQAGVPVAGPVRLIDQGKTIDVDTGYQLVDVIPAPGGELSAVLQAPSGELVTRSSKTDRVEQNRLVEKFRDLFAKAPPRVVPPPRQPVAPNPNGGNRNLPPSDQ